MLLLLLLFLFTSWTCITAGFFLYRFLAGGAPANPDPVRVLLTGLMALTGVAQGLALFVPVRLSLVAAPLVAMGIAALLFDKDYRRFMSERAGQFRRLHLSLKAGISAFVLLLLLVAAGPTLMDDTESYHIQMVRWIQQWGTVPGLANLHERYGFNSSWFSAIAFFGMPGEINGYTFLNATLSIWLAVSLLLRTAPALRKEATSAEFRTGLTAVLVLTACLVAWPLLRGNAATANYDHIGMVASLLLLIELQACRRAPSPELLFECVLWPCFLFTVRVINFPLLGLSLWALWTQFRQNAPGRTAGQALAGILLAVPFLARTYLLSGYLFYPSPAFAFFHPDWRVPMPMLENLMRYIRFYNRINPTVQPLVQTEQLTGLSWVGPWARHLLPYDQWLVLLGGLGYLLSPFHRPSKALRCLIACLLLQAAVWFVLAPDPRFIYGVWVCGLWLLAGLVARVFPTAIAAPATKWMATALAAAVIALLVLKPARDPGYRNAVLPTPLPHPATDTVQIGPVRALVPARINGNWNPRCYALPVPCFYLVEPGLHLRGRTLREGFSVLQPGDTAEPAPARRWTDLP